MIFPYGLPDRGKEKTKKICNYENCPYLCSVGWFEGSFTLLWLPFSKRKIGCLNATHYRSNTRKYKTLLCSIPRMMK